ncbi:MAG: PIG-L family deacetylase [Intrasporangium sp.]|uniref:PIG-L deacetylase family protein n=1 Tax=Intrasporangium sp. TaxID=1925024 RepID=UPI002647C2D6|nr:PIG-L deacetylase family protein [Intrasporangium sp.]MDN5794292.1 PIG-L family deacetylase [Intrasporangium sp.]
MPDLEIFDDPDIARVLCVVAHPDDMEYGASAAVAEWTSRGIEVAYLLLTSGEAGIRDRDPAQVGPLRAEEQRRACARVGVHDLTILDLPDGVLQPDLATRRHVARRIRQVRPDAILCTTWELDVPWGLNHADHRAAGLATADAIRDADNPWVFRELREQDGLEPWSTRWLLVTGMTPTHAIELGGDAVEKAVASLEAHEAYLAALPGHPEPRELVTGIVTGGGEAAGVDRALGVRAIRMG